MVWVLVSEWVEFGELVGGLVGGLNDGLDEVVGM